MCSDIVRRCKNLSNQQRSESPFELAGERGEGLRPRVEARRRCADMYEPRVERRLAARLELEGELSVP